MPCHAGSGIDTDSYPVDPFLVAAKQTTDSVWSHHTALEFHGKAYPVIHTSPTRHPVRLDL